MIENVGIQELAEQHAAVVRGRMRPELIGEFVGSAYAEALGTLTAQRRSPAGPPFIRYGYGEGGMDAVGQAEEFVLAAGFPTDGPVTASGTVEPETLPGGVAVVAMHVGRWDEMGEAYQAVSSWMAEHGMVSAGDPWETYLDGPEVEVHRTTLTWPCRMA